MMVLLIRHIKNIAIRFYDRLMRFIAWWIATGYFLFRPDRLKYSLKLYQTIFPSKRGWRYFYDAWRQFHGLASCHCDRFKMYIVNGISITSEGDEHLSMADKGGRGGIIIISHIGSFEIAAYYFKRYGFKLMIMMGEKEANRLAHQQRENLKSRGIAIHVSSSQKVSPLDGIEALNFLKNGGFVSIAGDIVWTDQRSLVPVRLFGQTVRISSAPYLLAMISGAPVFTLFHFRLDKFKYHMVLSPLRAIVPASRADRKAVIQAGAQEYANALEAAVRNYPYQWYIFEPFFGSGSE